MNCNLTINPPTGTPAGPGFKPPGAVSSITVGGTANTATVNLQCTGRQPQQVPVANGQWQITMPVIRLSPNTWAAACGENVTVIATAIDAAGNQCLTEWLGVLSYPGCPTVSVDPPAVGNCVAGTTQVTLTVSNVAQPPGQQAALQWDFGDGTLGVAFPVPGTPIPFATQHSYTSGNFVAQLNVIVPTGCPPVLVQLGVPPCNDCPAIQGVTFAEGPCDDQGNRPVTATVVGGPVGTISWQRTGDPQPHIGGVSDTKSCPGGSTQSVAVIITSGSCEQLGSNSHVVNPCPGQPCPSVTNLAANPGSGPAPLLVTFQATVTNAGSIVPDSNGNLYHWIFGDGASTDTVGQSTSHTYASPPGSPPCVSVNVPQGCGA